MTKSFIINRTFNAPRDQVWQAWTDPKMLAEWFGPKGSKGRVLKHELKVGGVLHTELNTPMSPEPMYGKMTYQEIAPKSKLVWLHSFSDKDGINLTRHPLQASWPLELLTTVELKDKGKQTDLTLTWVPVNATDDERKTFEENIPGMNQGWGGSFDQLDEMLAQAQAA